MNINPDHAADLRRAGVFIKHHANGSRDGMNAVLLEALDVGRPNQFVEAILGTFDAIVPQLITPPGQRCMAEMILTLADDPELDTDWNRAARFLIAYGHRDRDRMDTVIKETDDVAPTILAILDVYCTVLPTLHTPFGLDIVERGIRALMHAEAKGQR